MKKKLIYLSFFLISTLSSCDNYLDIRQEATLPISGIDYTKTGDMFKPISNAYASLRNGSTTGMPYIGIFEVVSDDAEKGSTAEDGSDMRQLDEFKYTSSNSLFNDLWQGYYNIVSASNFAINTLPNYFKYLTTDENKTLYRQYMAEAKFIRAYSYFNLNRVFGGVPLIDTALTSIELSNKVRASKEETYNFILKDLSEGVNNLPASYSKDMAGRVTKYTAMAFKAKVFLYQEKWDSVLYYTNLIINSKRYSLNKDFYSLFRIEGENGSESLFEIQSSTLGKTTGDAPYVEYSFIQGPRGNAPSNMQGWGFKVPSSKLIAFLNARNDIVRYNATILTRGSKTSEGDSIKGICPNPYYNMKTYCPSTYNKWSYNGYGFDNNIRIMRYAEVLLMNAEANIQKGDIPSAKNSLNEVRKRVGLADIENPKLQDIYDERRAELALEENRFSDLVRTGQASSALGSLGFTTGKNEVFPIPIKQIQLNTKLTQNIGYN